MATKSKRNRPPAAVEIDHVAGSHGARVEPVVLDQVNGVLQSGAYYSPSEPDCPADSPLKLAQLVRERRQQRGLSQDELARRIGVSKAAISSIEIGRTRSLRGPTLAGLMRELGISPEELTGKRPFLARRTAYTSSDVGGPDRPPLRTRIRVVGAAILDPAGFWPVLAPPLKHLGKLDFPSDDPQAYAVRIVGDAMHPRMRSGEFVVIEPGHECAPGDEVLVTLTDGRSILAELAYHRDGTLAVNTLGATPVRMTFADDQVDALHFAAAIVKATRFAET